MNATLKGDFWKVTKAPPWLLPKLVGLPRGQEELINAVKNVIEKNMVGFEKREDDTMSVKKEPNDQGANKVIIKYYDLEIELGRIENTAFWHNF